MIKFILILSLLFTFGCYPKKKGWTGQGYTLSEEKHKSCKEVCNHIHVNVKWYGKYCKCLK